MSGTGSVGERGAVSIFVVIFAALLLTIVTVSFVRIMLQDQDQASRNDLSQSAYDSAQAGVEDAKRALLRYMNACKPAPVGNPSDCASAQTAVASTSCNEIVRFGNVVGADSEGDTTSGRGEIRVQQTTGDNVLNQAYTCVTAQLNTDDVIGNLASSGSTVLPLKSEVGRPFNQVTIEWFSREDLGGPDSDGTIDVRSGVDIPMPLLSSSNWPINRPSLLRAQLMQMGSSFTLSDFDASSGSESNANTVFLYPTGGAGASSAEFLGRDGRNDDTGVTAAVPSNAPLPTRCQNVTSGGYACRMTLDLPTPIGGGDRQAYLRLTSLYNGAHFRVTLSNNGAAEKFSGVQPIVDSTGRANDIFRRISARVNLYDFPYPDAALDITGNLCKSFSITDTEYFPGTGDYTCTP